MNRHAHAKACSHLRTCSRQISIRQKRQRRTPRLPPPTERVIFDLTDPAERFIVEVIQRYFSNPSRGETVLVMQRWEAVVDGGRHRLVIQATRFRPHRPGARTEWTLLVWNIDQPGVTFLKQPSRAAVLKRFRQAVLGAHLAVSWAALPNS